MSWIYNSEKSAETGRLKGKMTVLDWESQNTKEKAGVLQSESVGLI